MPTSSVGLGLRGNATKIPVSKSIRLEFSADATADRVGGTVSSSIVMPSYPRVSARRACSGKSFKRRGRTIK